MSGAISVVCLILLGCLVGMVDWLWGFGVLEFLGGGVMVIRAVACCVLCCDCLAIHSFIQLLFVLLRDGVFYSFTVDTGYVRT